MGLFGKLRKKKPEQREDPPEKQNEPAKEERSFTRTFTRTRTTTKRTAEDAEERREAEYGFWKTFQASRSTGRYSDGEDEDDDGDGARGGPQQPQGARAQDGPAKKKHSLPPLAEDHSDQEGAHGHHPSSSSHQTRPASSRMPSNERPSAAYRTTQQRGPSRHSSRDSRSHPGPSRGPSGSSWRQHYGSRDEYDRDSEGSYDEDDIARQVQQAASQQAAGSQRMYVEKEHKRQDIKGIKGLMDQVIMGATGQEQKRTREQGYLGGLFAHKGAEEETLLRDMDRDLTELVLDEMEDLTAVLNVFDDRSGQAGWRKLNKDLKLMKGMRHHQALVKTRFCIEGCDEALERIDARIVRLQHERDGMLDALDGIEEAFEEREVVLEQERMRARIQNAAREGREAAERARAAQEARRRQAEVEQRQKEREAERLERERRMAARAVHWEAVEGRNSTDAGAARESFATGTSMEPRASSRTGRVRVTNTAGSSGGGRAAPIGWVRTGSHGRAGGEAATPSGRALLSPGPLTARASFNKTAPAGSGLKEALAAACSPQDAQGESAQDPGGSEHNSAPLGQALGFASTVEVHRGAERVRADDIAEQRARRLQRLKSSLPARNFKDVLERTNTKMITLKEPASDATSASEASGGPAAHDGKPTPALKALKSLARAREEEARAQGADEAAEDAAAPEQIQRGASHKNLSVAIPGDPPPDAKPAASVFKALGGAGKNRWQAAVKGVVAGQRFVPRSRQRQGAAALLGLAGEEEPETPAAPATPGAGAEGPSLRNRPSVLQRAFTLYTAAKRANDTPAASGHNPPSQFQRAASSAAVSGATASSAASAREPDAGGSAREEGEKGKLERSLTSHRIDPEAPATPQAVAEGAPPAEMEETDGKELRALGLDPSVMLRARMLVRMRSQLKSQRNLLPGAYKPDGADQARAATRVSGGAAPLNTPATTLPRSNAQWVSTPKVESTRPKVVREDSREDAASRDDSDGGGADAGARPGLQRLNSHRVMVSDGDVEDDVPVQSSGAQSTAGWTYPPRHASDDGAASEMGDWEELQLEEEAAALEEQLWRVEELLVDLEDLWEAFEWATQAAHAYACMLMGHIEGTHGHLVRILVDHIKHEHIADLLMLVLQEDDVEAKKTRSREVVRKVTLMEAEVAAYVAAARAAHEDVLDDLNDVLLDMPGDVPSKRAITSRSLGARAHGSGSSGYARSSRGAMSAAPHRGDLAVDASGNSLDMIRHGQPATSSATQVGKAKSSGAGAPSRSRFGATASDPRGRAPEKASSFAEEVGRGGGVGAEDYDWGGEDYEKAQAEFFSRKASKDAEDGALEGAATMGGDEAEQRMISAVRSRRMQRMQMGQLSRRASSRNAESFMQSPSQGPLSRGNSAQHALNGGGEITPQKLPPVKSASDDDEDDGGGRGRSPPRSNGAASPADGGSRRALETRTSSRGLGRSTSRLGRTASRGGATSQRSLSRKSSKKGSFREQWNAQEEALLLREKQLKQMESAMASNGGDAESAASSEIVDDDFLDDAQRSKYLVRRTSSLRRTRQIGSFRALAVEDSPHAGAPSSGGQSPATFAAAGASLRRIALPMDGDASPEPAAGKRGKSAKSSAGGSSPKDPGLKSPSLKNLLSRLTSEKKKAAAPEKERAAPKSQVQKTALADQRANSKKTRFQRHMQKTGSIVPPKRRSGAEDE
ncbi:unnamed protein product [Pedinophyceae sp. YPF-701]|nr:unnamed protein product [Pedinophyceae sp. YPF-701]